MTTAVTRKPHLSTRKRAPDSPFLRKASEEYRRKKHRTERLVLYSLLLVAGFLVGVNWYTDGWLMNQMMETLYKIEGDTSRTGFREVDCKNPRNATTPYCQGPKGATDQMWKSMSRTEGGKLNPFTLYKRK